MKYSVESAMLMLSNSPFWYMEGWSTLIHFTIDPAASGDSKGIYNRDLSSWGYEKRYQMGSDGYFIEELATV